jgi:glucose 1-dehydrogenase
MDFNRKVAIVTGAARGIGFEICRQLVKAGAQVILNDVDSALADTAARHINDAASDPSGEMMGDSKRGDTGHTTDGYCLAITGDCGDLSFIKGLVDTAVTRFGHLDIVIANAGITLFGDFLSYTPESFFRIMQVNLAGTFFLAQASANQMKKQPSGGSLLFTSSVTGHQAHKNLAAYSMSKAAIEMLARNLVIELSQFRININTIAPGATLTERTTDDPDYQAVWSGLTPMGRPATPADIAHAAMFLVSENARHITGQTLIIDGGWSCISPSP